MVALNFRMEFMINFCIKKMAFNNHSESHCENQMIKSVVVVVVVVVVVIVYWKAPQNIALNVIVENLAMFILQ